VDGIEHNAIIDTVHFIRIAEQTLVDLIGDPSVEIV
jgi:hypothetical protein